MALQKKRLRAMGERTRAAQRQSPLRLALLQPQTGDASSGARMNHFTVSALLTSVFSVAVCLYALTHRNGGRRVNRFLALYWCSIASWSFFVGLQAWFLVSIPATLWGWLLHLGALCVPATFFHFTLVLTQRVAKSRAALVIVYGLTALFLLLNSFTRIFTNGIAYREGYAYPIPALLYPVFFVTFVSFVSWGTVLMLTHLRSIHSERRAPFIIFLIFHLLACLGGMDNFAIMWDIKIFPLYPFGLYAVVLYACTAIYAAKKNVFSIS